MPKSFKNPTKKVGANIDLLTIGDSSIDLFMKVPPDAHGIQDLSDRNHNNKSKMCFYHGSKIMVEGFSTSIAGNSVNVAAGASLLGINSAVYTETGGDDNAERMVKELRNLGVDTSLLIKNPGTDTALHAVIVYNGERTIFSYHGNRNYSILPWSKPKFIYYTSMGSGFEKFQKELVGYIDKNTDVGLVFNPGTFQMAAGTESLKNVLAITDILFVNKEEAIRLTNSTELADYTNLHKKLAQFGVKLSVITDGGNGASAYDGKKLWQQDVYKDERPIVDMTGAGDAFSAAFMAAIIYGKELRDALKWGVVNSAAQIKTVGSIAGMLDRVSLESLLK